MKLLLAIVFVGASLPAMIAAPTVVISTAPRPAPVAAVLPSVREGGFPNRFPYGQCTWWAAYNRQVSWGGNAADWLVNASAQGVPISDLPSPGAIVVYRAGSGYSEYGHVAIVTASSASAYTVSEMNYLGWAKVNNRTVPWPDPHVSGFIPLSGGQR